MVLGVENLLKRLWLSDMDGSQDTHTGHTRI